LTDRDHDAASKLLIDEIEEDLKREQYAKLWKTYGSWIIAAAIAVVVVVAGHQGWKAWQAERRTSEATTYANVTALPPGEAAAALAKLSADAKTGYQELAALRRASLLAESGDVAAATAAYDAIAADQSVPDIYRGLATLRGVILQMETGDPAALDGKLQSLVGGPWRHTAQELQAVLAQHRGDSARARELYQRLADDLTTPPGLRARAAEMLAVLGPAPAGKG
jgi:hypothetical protein